MDFILYGTSWFALAHLLRCRQRIIRSPFVRRTIAFHVPQTWSLPAARETDEKLSPWHYSDKKDVLVMEVYHEYTMSITNDPFANAHRLKTLATIV